MRWLRQLATDAPCAPLRRSAGVRWGPGACSGGHTGRPYGCTADSVRRAGCPHPAEPGRRDCRASKYRSSRRSSRRGGLHARPCRTAGSNRPSVIAARSWRHVGMPPYGVRRSAAETGGHSRADIKSAPTAGTGDGAAGGLPCTRRADGRAMCAPTTFGGGAVGPGACTGGHTGRPYGCTADSVRRAGCPHPAEPGRRDCRASKYRSSRRSSRRGGLHARPCRTAGSNRPSVIAARSWRHVGMPPYGVRRSAAETGGHSRADIKSAPTAGTGDGAAGGLPCTRRADGRAMCAPTAFGGGAVGAGGLHGRPYRPPLRVRTLAYGVGRGQKSSFRIYFAVFLW